MAVQRNVMLGNGGEIELFSDQSLTSCVDGPVLGGTNDGAACPIITGETTSGGDVTGINGTACSGCTVDVYTASNGFSDVGNTLNTFMQGGAQVYLGTVTAGSCSPTPCNTATWTLPSSCLRQRIHPAPGPGGNGHSHPAGPRQQPGLLRNLGVRPQLRHPDRGRRRRQGDCRLRLWPPL